MKKKVVAVLLMVSMVAALAIGCGSKRKEEVKKTRELRKKQNMNKLWKREF